MGCAFGMKSCGTNPANPRAVAPNPDPSRFNVELVYQTHNAYCLLVRYLDCTNFEGRKVLVIRGHYTDSMFALSGLDPHFREDPNSPVARFVPTPEGWQMALTFADTL